MKPVYGSKMVGDLWNKGQPVKKYNKIYVQYVNLLICILFLTY